MPGAGQLSERIAFDKPSPTTTAGGGTEIGWDEQFVVAARRQFLRGGERVQADRMDGRQPMVLTIRASTQARQIATDWRARDARSGSVFNIVSVEPAEDRAWLAVVCEGGGSGLMAFNNGLSRLKRKLARLPKDAEAEIRKSLTVAADQIVTTQKSFAPVDDGTLRGTIRHEPVEDDGGRIRVRITAGGAATTRPVREGQSATYDYALAQEFGTEDGAAQPFFFPGYRSNKKRAKARVRRGVKAAAKKAVGQ